MDDTMTRLLAGEALTPTEGPMVADVDDDRDNVARATSALAKHFPGANIREYDGGAAADLWSADAFVNVLVWPVIAGARWHCLTAFGRGSDQQNLEIFDETVEAAVDRAASFIIDGIARLRADADLLGAILTAATKEPDHG